MKKIKIIVSITLCLLSFLLFSNVEALNLGSRGITPGIGRTGYGLYTFSKYSLNIDGTTYYPICLDPAAATDRTNIQVTELGAVHEKRIYHMLTAELPENYSNPDSDLGYTIRHMAVRAYSVGFVGGRVTPGTDNLKNTSAFYNLAADWLPKEKENMKGMFRGYIGGIDFTFPGSMAEIGQIAKEILVDAYYNYDEVTPETDLPEVKVTQSTSKPVYEDEKYTLTKTITFQPSNFGETGKLLQLSIVGLDMENIISIKYFDSKNKEIASEDIEGMSLANNEKITIEIHANVITTDCDELNFDINYRYSDEKFLYGGELMIYTGNSGTDQRFAVVIPSKDSGDIEQGGTEPVAFDICPFVCNTQIDIPKDCYEIDEDVIGGSVIAPTDINKCIVAPGAKDDAGNSYSAGTCSYDNGPTKDESAYCNISCKEDYNPIKFSGVQAPVAGRHFKIGAEISSTKTCYTNEIDYDRHQADIAAATTKEEEQKLNDELALCTTWNMKYDSVPTIEYSYDSVFMDQVPNETENLVVIDEDKKDTIIEYCSNDVENINECNWTTNEVKNPNFVRQSISKTIKLDTPSNFYTEFPTGDIKYSVDELVDEYVLVDGLPVDIKIEKGEYQFEFKMKNLGEFYDGNGEVCETGRLMNDTKEKDSVADITADNPYLNPNAFGNHYVCSYIPEEDCPECEYDGEFDIDPYCPNCIFDGDFQMTFRTISLNEFNPNDRKLGYNFDIATDFGFISGKASNTITNITSQGEKIYDKESVLKVEVTPEMAESIRNHNEDNSYQNNSLSCYDYVKDGIVYENVFCYSDYLDQLEDEFSDNVEFSNRPDSSDGDRQNYHGDYWMTYTEGINDNVQNNFGIEDSTKIGGPSWK